jgi:hypothetical protein
LAVTNPDSDTSRPASMIMLLSALSDSAVKTA